MMIAFLVFLALMIAFIVGSACISMYLFRLNWTGYVQTRPRQLVTLSQVASIEEGVYRPRRSRLETGMNQCVWRTVGISLALVTVVLFLIIAFFVNTF
jgi:hypothetical protein